MCISYNVMCKAEIIYGELHRVLIRYVDRKHLNARAYSLRFHPYCTHIILRFAFPEKKSFPATTIAEFTTINQYVSLCERGLNIE